MLQVARLSPKMLGESSELVGRFIQKQINEDGGFKDRRGESDLYYTVFGLDCLAALQLETPTDKLISFLESFETGQKLDFVHQSCLAHCWASVGLEHLNPTTSQALLANIEAHRSQDGGYGHKVDSEQGMAYGCFLALGAYTNLKQPLPRPLEMVQCLKLLETSDGAWSNDRRIQVGSIPATAAAVSILRNLDQPMSTIVVDWLMKQLHPQGGFTAVPQAPMPDLLSTAVALHALSGLEVDLSSVREHCLDFIDTLWTNDGSFHGNWTDEILDTEYTFYGLLALGHLAV